MLGQSAIRVLTMSKPPIQVIADIADIVVPNIWLADHLPIFIWRKYLKLPNQNKNNTIEYRNFKKLNSVELQCDLLNISWDSFVTDDINGDR